MKVTFMTDMTGAFKLVEPSFLLPLDEGFRPAVLANRAFRQEIEQSRNGAPLALGLECPGGFVSRFETEVFLENHPRASANLVYAERLFKFLLWQRGAWKVSGARFLLAATSLFRFRICIQSGMARIVCSIAR